MAINSSILCYLGKYPKKIGGAKKHFGNFRTPGLPPTHNIYLSDTFIEYLCNLIDYCTTKWRRQYYCTIYNKMRQRCLLAWIV